MSAQSERGGPTREFGVEWIRVDPAVESEVVSNGRPPRRLRAWILVRARRQEGEERAHFGENHIMEKAASAPARLRGWAPARGRKGPDTRKCGLPACEKTCDESGAVAAPADGESH